MHKFNRFKEFYPFYLEQHSDPTCKLLHFIGSWLVLTVLAFVILTGTLAALWFVPIIGYGFAWVGHFFFEQNKPATFSYPFYSLLGDWVMFKDILAGNVDFKK